jgi:two-component system, LytTR family, sensor kinase
VVDQAVFDLSMPLLKKRIKMYWLTAGVAIVATLLLIQFNPSNVFYFSAGWLLLIAVLLWLGNRQLTTRLDGILPWERFGNWRFFIHLVLGLLYLLLLINLTYVIIKVLVSSSPSLEQIMVMNVWGAAIFIPVFSLYFSLHFLRHWRKSELEVTQYQKESMRSQLDSLKNHLDPHFLFNNLNILTSLIDKDQAASKLFIQNFADVYRTLLRAKAEDLIPVREELDFIQSYMYLMRVRFENLIEFKATISPAFNKGMVPPLTLQMLVENAIKHNGLTETQPLVIEMLDGPEGYLVIRNTVQLKPSKTTEEGGTGLNNIRQRYAHFTDLPVQIRQTAELFEVQIPLLKIEP